MAFPLKSGADLYNNQLIRAAIWNYSADIIEPSELVTGLIYFNTSNSSAGKKLRLYTGSVWKTLAFEEDLDVANNAEFKALEDKVKLLAGEVDTDAIISNMKDVENFLAGFNESGGTLMNYLNTELGKKLDLSGGTIAGDFGILSIKRKDPYGQAIKFENSAQVLGYIGFDNSNKGIIYEGEATGASHFILHSGNIGEYKAGDSDKLGGSPYYDFPKALFTNDLNPLNYTSRPLFITAFRANEGTSADYGTLIVPTWSGNSAEKYYLSELRFPLGVAPQFRTSFNGEASDWKTIAFTDSTVEAARKLVNSNGNALFYTANSNILYDGKGRVLMDYADDWQVFGEWTGYKTGIRGSSIEMAIDGKIAAFINSSGNVTIGSSDLAGTSATAKLYVDGYVTTKDGVVINAADAYNSYWEKGFLFSSNSALNAGLWGYGYKSLEYLYLGFGNYSAAVGIRINENGNVGIGLTNPSAQLHVAQDIVANGTIACKGIAAEGDAMDMVDKVVLHIVPNGNQQTFTLNHGLGTREITISIYEITSMGTNMILTDVEIVDDNNISVSFGNPPTDNHMVVVMG